jgi:hypothetical protein
MIKLDCGGRSGAGSSFSLQPVVMNKLEKATNPMTRNRFLIVFIID